MVRIRVFKEPIGKHLYAIHATFNGIRERHTHFLTKEEAEHFKNTFTSETAKKYGFRNVRIVKHKPIGGKKQ